MSEMTTNRLEAFSDGVIALIITIMVLELRPPPQPTLAAVVKVAPIFIGYALSFLAACAFFLKLTLYGKVESYLSVPYCSDRGWSDYNNYLGVR
jgi:uncharacterized membrane protein